MLIDVYKIEYNDDFYVYCIEYGDPNEPKSISVNSYDWNKSTIVNNLIRSKYSQDSVEALVNNHLMKLAEWQDKVFEGENPGKLEDPEYAELQEWRKLCKQWADEALEKFPE